MKSKALLFIFCLFLSCEYQRAPAPGFKIELKPFGKAQEEKDPYFLACAFGTIEEMERFLKDGRDPNYVKAPPGSIPWHDNNPLWLAPADYDRAALLIHYGADVTKRPYIATALSRKIISEKYPDLSLRKYAGVMYERELYDLVKLYLDAGADPNYKGMMRTPVLRKATDKEYKKYYDQYGWLPINFAIRENAFAIVDLLFEYGSYLDEDSLLASDEATESIGNREMQDYIRKKWEGTDLREVREIR
jgi:hypothetical protein